MATTLLIGPAPGLPAGPWLDRGSLIQAKSRAGSHISLTPLGRYPPTLAATAPPTFWEVRRIMPIKVPLCFLAEESEPASPPVSSSSCECAYALGGEEWSRAGGEYDEDPSDDGPCLVNLKIWTVSVDEDTHRSVDVVLKDML